MKIQTPKYEIELYTPDTMHQNTKEILSMIIIDEYDKDDLHVWTKRFYLSTKIFNLITDFSNQNNVKEIENFIDVMINKADNSIFRNVKINYDFY